MFISDKDVHVCMCVCMSVWVCATNEENFQKWESSIIAKEVHGQSNESNKWKFPQDEEVHIKEMKNDTGIIPILWTKKYPEQSSSNNYGCVSSI